MSEVGPVARGDPGPVFVSSRPLLGPGAGDTAVHGIAERLALDVEERALARPPDGAPGAGRAPVPAARGDAILVGIAVGERSVMSKPPVLYVVIPFAAKNKDRLLRGR